jgi:hypothetical protein
MIINKILFLTWSFVGSSNLAGEGVLIATRCLFSLLVPSLIGLEVGTSSIHPVIAFIDQWCIIF